MHATTLIYPGERTAGAASDASALVGEAGPAAFPAVRRPRATITLTIRAGIPAAPVRSARAATGESVRLVSTTGGRSVRLRV